MRRVHPSELFWARVGMIYEDVLWNVISYKITTIHFIHKYPPIHLKIEFVNQDWIDFVLSSSLKALRDPFRTVLIKDNKLHGAFYLPYFLLEKIILDVNGKHDIYLHWHN